MCGIIGIIDKSGGMDISQIIGPGLSALYHRGPDSGGTWSNVNDGVILGHRRLSIIDLSDRADQPMRSSDGRYVITYNGEIYNYIELKADLAKDGCVFRTDSDTEVILEAISTWGLEQSLSKFRGMFAFALWDTKERRLFLVRDRVGKKPLCFYSGQNLFCFASEIKAIIKLVGVHLSLDPESIDTYLSLGYIPSPHSIFREIHKVPPAHYISVNREFQIQWKEYWTLDWKANNTKIGFDEAVEKSEELLKEAIKIRLRADVPIGCFLSGGIDSGLVTAIAAQHYNKPFIALTVGVDQASLDERYLARLVARKFNLEHHIIEISPFLENELPRFVQAYDEPFADPSAIPSLCVSSEARKYVTVVLNGDGGDEIFCGYRRYQAAAMLRRFGGNGSYILDILKKISRHLPTPKSARNLYSFAHRFLRGIDKDIFDRYIVWGSNGFNSQEKSSLLGHGRETFSGLDGRFLKSRSIALRQLDPLSQFLAMDFYIELPECLLVKMDIATMASSLEARSPFLDHKLIEFAISLPPTVRMRGLRSKAILRKIAEKYLPPEVCSAPKRGFEIPLSQLLSGSLFNTVRDTCLSTNGILNTLFEGRYSEDLIYNRFSMDHESWARKVWMLFVLSLWYDNK